MKAKIWKNLPLNLNSSNLYTLIEGLSEKTDQIKITCTLTELRRVNKYIGFGCNKGLYYLEHDYVPLELGKTWEEVKKVLIDKNYIKWVEV